MSLTDTTTRAVDRLSVPLIVAPMTGVSGVNLVAAACRAGVVGSFPTHNAGSPVELDDWLHRIAAARPPAGQWGLVAPNLVVHRSNPRLDDDVEVLARHRVELVIASVGSPASIVEPLHAAGTQVLADVASLRHVDRALEAGADGLVLLGAGAGGQTGWANPFAFVRAVRERFAGPIVLAGGIGDGWALHAARVLGADLGYLGTRFIASAESLASDAYRSALVSATMDDVHLTAGAGGLPASLLEGSPSSSGGGFSQAGLLAAGEVWSAGHCVSGVHRVEPAAEIISRVEREYLSAVAASDNVAWPDLRRRGRITPPHSRSPSAG
ncbi:MAG: nitronate monooxygenase [Pseudonocardia sp.]|nr:nitronate monooxygenase [Pseudonocardia sp.]